MLGLLLCVTVLAGLVSGQQVGQRIGPATDDKRGMQGQQGFPPGAALGDAYYAKLTAYGGVNDGMTPDQPSYGVKEGACGYGLLNKQQWPFWNAVALRADSPLLTSLTRPSHGCGMCLQITCVDKARCKTTYPIVAQVTDICPTCTAPMHLDGHVGWVDKLLSVHNALIKVQRVHCVPPFAALHVVVMDYRGPGLWLRLRLEKVAGRAVATRMLIQDQTMGTTWNTLRNTWGAVWETGTSPRGRVVRLRITNDAGTIRTTTWLSLTTGRLTATAVQLPTIPLSGIVWGSPAWTQCRDVAPDGSATCAQQKSWGKCGESWMRATVATQWGYCAVTCGRCSPSGRKLLAGNETGLVH